MSVAKRSSPPFLQDARQPPQVVILNEAPFPVPSLRPRIGIKQVDQRQRCIGQPVQQFAGVAEMQADILQPALVDRNERFGDGIDETIGADEGGAGMRLRLRYQMLRATKADLEPQCINGRGKKRAQIGGGRLRSGRARASAAAYRTGPPDAA